MDDALAMHRDSLITEPEHPDLMQHYSETLEVAGDLPGALAVMEEIAVLTDGAPLYMPRLLELRARLAPEAGSGMLVSPAAETISLPDEPAKPRTLARAARDAVRRIRVWAGRNGK